MKVDPIRVVLAFSIWFLLMVAATAYYLWQWVNTARPLPDVYRSLEIEKGASLYALAYDLHDKDLIRWPRAWVLYARFSDMADIKAGEYLLSEKESPFSLLSRFQHGDVVQHQITLVEGISFQQVLMNLHNHKRVKAELSGKTIAETLASLDLPIEHPEGWFFPDTYNFINGESDIAILRRAYQRMTDVLDYEWKNRSDDLPYAAPYEALIMASIVEKETGVSHERREIAGVFVRRLHKKMRLQTDPTVIYGLGSDFDGNITRADLKNPTPYNTYVIKGLPPTPIAMPGKQAIHAALNPGGGNNLFFVAKGDGTHQFSNTLDEHTKAVRQYQKRRREDYRSSPSKQN